MELREKIAQYAYLYQGDYNQIAKAIAQKEEVKFQPIFEQYITIVDKEYPKILKSLEYPPWILFYQGDISLLNTKMVTVIGSRLASQKALENCSLICQELLKNFTIVSGLAKGIDGYAHQTAIEYDGKTIGVIGSGLKYQYPLCNQLLYQKMKTNHLILSEYPFATPVMKHHFPWRNRILACLGMHIIVVEASRRSGTMHTVNQALSLGKNIFAVAGNFEDETTSGCSQLIEDGATILYEIEQLRSLSFAK